MNYYPFHLGDYASHTAHLDPMEDLAYRRMIDLYYLREWPLPNCVHEVSRLIRMRDQSDAVDLVLREFFILSEDGWKHDRCDEEIAKMQDKQAKARTSAAASVAARRATAERMFNVRSTDVELPTPTPTPTPKEKIKTLVASSDACFGFDAFWKDYPRKTAKANALKAWKKIKADSELLQIILDAVRKQSDSSDWRKDGGQFVPHAATWLNGRRWEDETDSTSYSSGSIFDGVDN